MFLINTNIGVYNVEYSSSHTSDEDCTTPVKNCESNDVQYLQKELLKSNKKINYLRKRKNKFRDELREHKAGLNSFSDIKYKELLESNLTEDQIKVLEFKRRTPNARNTMKWSDCSIKKGLTLKFTCGSTGYNQIRKYMPLYQAKEL